MNRFKEWLKEWQDGVLWLPIALLIFVAAWWWLPKLDPRSGIDGLGSLFAYALLLLKGILCVFMAWLCKRTYTGEFNDTKPPPGGIEPKILQVFNWPYLTALVLDRLEWAAWIGFWFYCLSH